MSFLNQEWIKESPCPSNEKFDSPSGIGHVSGSYTYTCVSVSPNICDTRCKGSDKVEFYCGSASGCGWMTDNCLDTGCDSSDGKCYCESDEWCKNNWRPADAYSNKPKCIQSGICSTCDCGSCSVTFSGTSGCPNNHCLITKSFCGCTAIADCCDPSYNSNLRGKCVSCGVDKKCDVDTGSTAPNCKSGYSVCCQYDSDCPAKDGRKGICDTTTHICEWGPCRYNSDCDAGYCCEKEVGSITTGYGCVVNGTIKDNKYLCDPPEWNHASNQTIFDLLFSHFKSLMQQIIG